MRCILLLVSACFQLSGRELLHRGSIACAPGHIQLCARRPQNLHLPQEALVLNAWVDRKDQDLQAARMLRDGGSCLARSSIALLWIF